MSFFDIYFNVFVVVLDVDVVKKMMDLGDVMV